MLHMEGERGGQRHPCDQIMAGNMHDACRVLSQAVDVADRLARGSASNGISLPSQSSVLSTAKQT